MVLNPFLQFVTRFRSKDVHTTNFSFKLITRITVNLWLFCIFTLFSSFFVIGRVIECFTGNSPLANIISQRCYAEGIYIDRSLLNASDGKVISPGVGAHYNGSDYYKQAYYQWIPPLLMLQAMIFYAPRGLWKLWEKEVMSKLVEENDSPVLTQNWKARRTHLVLYMRNINRKYHRFYVVKYFICEILSVASVVFNMFLMKWVLTDFWVEFCPAIAALFKGDFTKYRQYATLFFPLQAKCIYSTFGPSGSPITHDALCYLPLNVANEKIFVFLYIWLIGILIYATFNLIYFTMMLSFNSLRIIAIKGMCERTVRREHIKRISGGGDFGYWFTLHIFHKNLSPVHFQDLADELIKKTKEVTFGVEIESS